MSEWVGERFSKRKWFSEWPPIEIIVLGIIMNLGI